MYVTKISKTDRQTDTHIHKHTLTVCVYVHVMCLSVLLSQVYLIEVTRPNGKERVFRRYSEFHEMHTKLAAQFPDHTLPALPGKIYVGRSQVRQVSIN